MKKHLTTLLALLLSCSMLGQNFPVPYNPDDDANGLIGTPDLLSLLAIFGEEFSAAVVSEDNQSAIVHVGDMAYPVCVQSCKNLPGMWDVAKTEDFGLVWAEIQQAPNDATWWVKPHHSRSESGDLIADFIEKQSYGTLYAKSDYLSPERGCFCSIKEIPKVEYSWCSTYNPITNTPGDTPGSGAETFENCCNAKVDQGWYPLGGLSRAGNSAGQAFWRWAE